MNEEIFGIENFNLISDEQYYYVFRALNIDDQTEIDRGITANNGVIQKVITNKQRYPENNKYANRSEISLQEVWDHTKSVNFYKGTNCISLSSNANVSIDYGSKYGHKYLMIKIPREQKSNVYNAGQYMTPTGDYETVETADGETWYKQYAQPTVERTPYEESSGQIKYNEKIVEQMPQIPKRKDRV